MAVVNFSGRDQVPDLLGIPMMFPITWEEKIAANMSKIPALELFPGLMVKDLYKAYRAGLAAGEYSPYNPDEPDDRIVAYIARATGKKPQVIDDFIKSMLRTVEAGQAPRDTVTGQAATGIAEKTGTVAATAAKAAKWPLTMIASVAVVGVLGYLYLTKKR